MVVVDRVAAGVDPAAVADGAAPAAAQRPPELAQAAQDKLERLYRVDPVPSSATLEMVAAASGSPVPVVDKWFQQRRAQDQRQATVETSLNEGGDFPDVDDLARVNRALMQDHQLSSDSDSDSNQHLEREPDLEPKVDKPEPAPQTPYVPDFSGRWVLAETVGMEAFLVALDVGYIKRTVALKIAESLVGKAEQVIEQSSDQIVFTARGPNNPEGTPSRFMFERAENINENPLLGTVTTKIGWTVSTKQLDRGPPCGATVLDAQMATADGRQSTMRRWCLPTQDGRPEALFVQTSFDGVSMTQRFDCVERSTRRVPSDPAERAAQATPAATTPALPQAEQPPRSSQLELGSRVVTPESKKIARARQRRQTRLAAVNNEHPVAQIAIAALTDAQTFVSDGWGEATVIAGGAAKIWRRISGSPGAKVVPVKTEGTVKGIDHISLRKLLVSAELKAAMGEASTASMLGLRMLEKVEIRSNSTYATGTVWYHTSKFPWPLQAREVCFVNCWTATPDTRTGEKRGRQIVVERSVLHERAPISSSFTRMTVDLVFCLEADGQDTRMTVCAEVDPGGDIPTRIVELAVGQMTDRLRNIADTIKTHRPLVDRILQANNDDDIHSSSSDEDEHDVQDRKENEDIQATRQVPTHRLVTEDMLEVGITQAFIVPAIVSQPACAKLGIEWSTDHERLAASSAPGLVVQVTQNEPVADKVSSHDDNTTRVHLRWMEQREATTPSPLEQFAPGNTARTASEDDKQEVCDKEVSIQVLRWEEGRNVNGVWTVDKFQQPNRHVRYVLQVRTKEKTYEVRRRWQHISDFNGELLKLGKGWLQQEDSWTVTKLPSSWSRPGFNPKKLGQRLSHLRGYFTRVAQWVTQLRSRKDKIVDIFAPDLHPRMHAVRDFLVAGSAPVDTATMLPSGEIADSGPHRPISMRTGADVEDEWAMDQEQEQPEDLDEEKKQDGSSGRPGRRRSASTGCERTSSAENLQPLTLSPLSSAEHMGEQSDDPSGITAEFTELVLVVPLSCIGLLVYPEPEPEPEPEPGPEPEPEAIGLTDSPMVDAGHLGRVAMSLADLSIVYHDAGVDMSVYDADDRVEQQKLQRLRSNTLEDLDVVNAAVKEARMVAAAMESENPVLTPRASLSHQPLSRRTSVTSAEADGGAQLKLAEGWEGVTVSVESVEISDGGGSYGVPLTTPYALYELAFAVDGIDAFRIKKRYSEMKEMHESMVAGGCFGWNGGETPEFAPMHMFSDMVTDRENVRLRGQELCKYFQKVVSDEGAMTHPVTARYLTFDGEMVQELRLEREDAAQAAEESRIREERRTEAGRSHCRLLSNLSSQTVFSHHLSVGIATHCMSRGAEASMSLAMQTQQQQQQ